MKKVPFIMLWTVFAAFMFFKLFTNAKLFLFLALWSTALGIHLLIKCGLPDKNKRLLSVILCAVSTAATIPMLLTQHGKISYIYLPLIAVPTLICSAALFAVMEQRKEIVFFHNENAKEAAKSIIIALAAGVVLATINTFFNLSNPQDISFTPYRIFMALEPAIFEEIACRAVFMAYFLYFSKGKMSKFTAFSMYLMMIMPHAVSHDMNIFGCIISGIVFGIPFALMNRKRDTVTAMTSHWFVDAVRFVIFGG